MVLEFSACLQELQQQQGNKRLARRLIEIFTPEGKTSYHATNREAFDIVQREDGFWTDETRKTVQLQPASMIGKATWRKKPSGLHGPLVLQMET